MRILTLVRIRYMLQIFQLRIIICPINMALQRTSYNQMFSAGNYNSNPTSGLFGSKPNNGFVGNVPQNNTQSSFGNSAPNQGGPFGQTNPQNTTAFGSPSNNNLGFNGNPVNPQGNPPNSGGMFGQSPNQGGLFGQQPNNPAPFGGASQQGGAFGQSNFNQGQNTQGTQGQGLFGQQNQNQSQNGFFGQQNKTAGGSGLVGATSGSNNNSFISNQHNSKPFAATNSPFGGNQNQGNSVFGGSQPNPSSFNGNSQGNSLFGNTSPQQPTQGGGGLFASFAPNQPNQQATSAFGVNSNGGANLTSSVALGGGNNANSKLGGTSWGVPTNQPNGAQPFQAVRSKNPKLDAKHMVKCIAAIDQFQGSCKEQLRVNFILNGGQQPALNQQGTNTTTSNSNNNSAVNYGYAKPQNPLNTIPSFGGSTNLGANSNSLFGAQQAQNNSSFLGGNKTTTAQPGSTLFGANPPTTTAFGTNPSAPQFGQTGAGGSLFGGANSGQPPQQQTNLYGGQQSQPQSSLFGSPSQPATSFLGGLNPQQPSANASMFNPSTPLQAPPSLYPTPGYTNAAVPQMYASPAGYPAQSLDQTPNLMNGGNLFSQLVSPLYQQGQQQQLDPNLQLLLPQLLLANAMNQTQQNQGPSANPTADLINKLISSLNLTKPAEQNSLNPNSNLAQNSLLTPTPFDEFMKEDASNKWHSRNQERQSLFTQAEIRQFEELDSRSYIDRIHRPGELREESFRLKHSYKPHPKRADPFGQSNYKIISRSYKQTQEQARKKYTPSNQDLPDLGNFTVEPSLDRLKNMTIQQLKKVEHVKISNSFGNIEFLDPISLYRKELTSSLKIAQDNIEIIDPEWQEKKVRMTFQNFGNYREHGGEQRGRLLKRMRMWISEFDMTEIAHDSITGELIVETFD